MFELAVISLAVVFVGLPVACLVLAVVGAAVAVPLVWIGCMLACLFPVSPEESE
jgi:hypothetical protein